MDIATLAGLILALIGVLGGMIYKGVPLSALANPAAIFIILIGTIGAVMNAFPMNEIKNMPKLLGIIFGNKQGTNNAEVVNKFVEYSNIVRKDGLLALESKTPEIEDPFFRRAIELLMTGQNRDFIEEVLDDEVTALESRHSANATIFSQAGAYAPTLGVLGAVIGLVSALSHMEDQAALGVAISAAFIATVYGIFTGYVLWHPFANKLKRKSKQEVLTKTIIIQGTLLLEQGLSPNLVQEKLISLLPPNDRAAFMSDTKGE